MTVKNKEIRKLNQYIKLVLKRLGRSPRLITNLTEATTVGDVVGENKYTMEQLFGFKWLTEKTLLIELAERIKFCILTHKCGTNNEQQIKLFANKVGCGYCCRIFNKMTVQEFTADHCAICPFCSVDLVIADVSGVELTKTNLKDLAAYWFRIPTPEESKEWHKKLSGKLRKQKLAAKKRKQKHEKVK